MSSQQDAQQEAQIESAVRNQQAQLRRVRDAEHAAKVSLAFLNFFKAHWREGLSTCIANRAALEEYCDERLMDLSSVENIETAYQAIKHQLAFVPISERVPPTAPVVTAPVEEVAPVSESDQIRLILQQNQGDPKAVAAAMRARLQRTDPARNRPTVLPAEITAAVIRNMTSTELRNLQTKWFGTDAINSRLAGRS